MKTGLKLCALVALISLHTTARAEAYLGGSVLSASYQYQDVGNSTGGQARLGYRAERWPLVIEAAWLDLGKAKVKDFSDGVNTLNNTELGFSGTNFSIGYFTPLPMRARYEPVSHAFGAWGKLGYYSGNSTLTGVSNGSRFHTRESSDGLSWGLGGEWKFASNAAVHLEFGGLEGVKDLPQLNSGHTSSISLINVGLTVLFPSFGPPPPRPQPRRHVARQPDTEPRTISAPPPAAITPVPVQPTPPATPTQPVPPQPAPAATSPAPTAAPAGDLAAGGHARLRAGAQLRTRSAADAEPVSGVAPAAVLTLKAVLKKDTGAWWYVESPEGSGWVRESDLEPVAPQRE